MDLGKGDMLIMSGEGDGPGTIERYEGARTAKAIRSRLSRERCHGDRWASVWIALPEMGDAGYPGVPVYGELIDGLASIGTMRAIPASAIRVNPAAQLRAGKPNAASAANGRKGGRPRTGTRRYMHVATGALDDRAGWRSSYTRDELADRGLTAAQAFAQDEGRTLHAVEYDGHAWVEAGTRSKPSTSTT